MEKIQDYETAVNMFGKLVADYIYNYQNLKYTLRGSNAEPLGFIIFNNTGVLVDCQFNIKE